jgi:hypothetical protein
MTTLGFARLEPPQARAFYVTGMEHSPTSALSDQGGTRDKVPVTRFIAVFL